LVGIQFREVYHQLLPVSENFTQHDTERIFEHVLNISRSELYLRFNATLSPNHLKEIQKLVKKRLTGLPLAYVLKHSYFYSKKFIISPDVLIPRPETEILIKIVCENIRDKNRSFIDFGTGSGIIAEALIEKNDTWWAVAVDISFPALKIAAQNCSEGIGLVCSDRLHSLKQEKLFDFIVSNPPYISQSEMKLLDRSVYDFEPRQALFGGVEGLDFYTYLAKNAAYYLKRGGIIFCEIGSDQESAVTRIFKDSGWKDIKVYTDLAKRPRVLKSHT
jgi:release factor glutamine methyltransferase